MTKQQLLTLVIGRARINGFSLRRWYTLYLEREWHSAEEAVSILCTERRYYALLFSHPFARSFWKAGTEMTFQVEKQHFLRKGSDGSIKSVTRKGYTRRLTREDAWRYHLRRMAAAEEPLRYIRRFLPVAEELEPESQPHAPTHSKESGPDPRFIIDEEDLLTEDD